jgi:hypothetical protein
MDTTSQHKYDTNTYSHSMSRPNLPSDHRDDVESARGSYEDTPERINVEVPLERRATLPPLYEQNDSRSHATPLAFGLSAVPKSTNQASTLEVTSDVHGKHEDVRSPRLTQHQVEEDESLYGDT